MHALFFASKQPVSGVEKWTAALQASGAPVRHVVAWRGSGDVGRRHAANTVNADTFLLGPGASLEAHIGQTCSMPEALLLVSLDPEQQLLPRSGVVLLIWQPQVPADLVQACKPLPPGLTDASCVRGLLLVDPAPSLTLSVTHKTLEGAGMHALARKPTVLATRTLQTPAATLVTALLQLADSLPPSPAPRPALPLGSGAVRIAVARDDAFGPCFHENLTLLHQAGAQLLFFSPLYDTALPAGAACLYLSSGPLEPERWQQLATNRPLLACVRAFCEAGGMVLGEGAGLLYLARSVELDEGDGARQHRVHEMAGVLPFKTRLLPEPQTADVQLRVLPGNPLLPAGCAPRGYLCAQASIVLVEERQLQGLVLPGLAPAGAGGAAAGKGGAAQFTTTYEASIVGRAQPRRSSVEAHAAQQQQGQQAQGQKRKALEPVLLPGKEAGEGGGCEALPEGYTVHNVLASSCLLYLPSEPGMAAHIVRRCACIDAAAVAAGMAQQLGCAAAKLHSAMASSAGSRGSSRRQSIQDVSAWGAGFSSNGGGTACSQNHNGSSNNIVGGHHHHHAPTVPPTGAASLAAAKGGVGSGASLSGAVGLPSPRLYQNAPQHMSSQALTGAGRPTQGQPAWGRPSQDSTGGAPAGLARLQQQQQQHPHGSGTSLHSIAASASMCSAGSAAALGAGMDAAEQQQAPAAWPGGAGGAVGAGYGEAPPLPTVPERGNSCSNGSASVDSSHLSHAASSGSTAAALCSARASPDAGLGWAAAASEYDADSRGPSIDAQLLHNFARVGSRSPSIDPQLLHGFARTGSQCPAPAAPYGSHHHDTGLAAGYGWGGGGAAPAPPPPRSSAVVCCSPGGCEALVAMGLGNRLAGVSSDCDHPPDVCGSRRVVLGWVAGDEVPLGAAARGIRTILPAAPPAPAAGGGGGGGCTTGPSMAPSSSGYLLSDFLSAGARGGGGGARPSVERCAPRGGRVLLLDELALRQDPPGVLVLPDLAELTEGERAQLEQYIRCPISTLVVGQAASMASLLLTAGEKGQRRSLPNSRIMLHQPLGAAEGQASDIMIRAQEIMRMKETLTSLYVRHTGCAREIVEKTLDRDSFMSATEAKEWGLIDEILVSRPAGEVHSS
ncbi:ATP-dependent Clp protease proteolytic subunit [Tetrabaena socialis]|uniref:ATP-dependent Clp protease proteolytic subunit n=1 Tax=Tetrabaena socialis TaxID=47790 RepID=A0A2J7ZX22_9CHLO|nr:ATP-dependent Clp protease proteolytic subunit [Tetrabaena socialis]|eukprot:PNH04808.1 ATP-dependent Clp protease proteolytic subunit [Tetrabaena socialis]